MPVKLQQAQRTGTGNGFGAPLYLEFVKDNPVMPFHRTEGEKQPLANLLIGETLRNKLQDLQLPLAQRLY